MGPKKVRDEKLLNLKSQKKKISGLTCIIHFVCNKSDCKVKEQYLFLGGTNTQFSITIMKIIVPELSHSHWWWKQGRVWSKTAPPPPLTSTMFYHGGGGRLLPFPVNKIQSLRY